ncbi:hypothetical protein [Thermocrinis minervae]|uniref:Stage V sporulation protein G n=1 Tax=Thermocrinis minervae TaxID=381751 RepID=A0A1M6Q7V4_9AQUI|nr:hypothetical protein [Thermocrinis minervae]SHK16359.1 stage V sporulation protein G [Thermocrinis minervae]
MDIKLIKFYPFEVSVKRPRLLAYVDLLLFDKVLIKGIKLLENKHGGYFVQMPEHVEIVSRDLLDSIRRVVVDYYKENLL